MISLEKLKLENFISHEDTEIDMGSLEGLIMIEGVNNSGKYDSNGSGKSSIIEGIVYGRYKDEIWTFLRSTRY